VCFSAYRTKSGRFGDLVLPGRKRHLKNDGPCPLQDVHHSNDPDADIGFVAPKEASNE
jgi:hypothetical protein